jgi:hypothetical protein
MDKYSKQAFRVTLILFLAILGLFAFLNIESLRSYNSERIPKTAFTCDYGAKATRWHYWFGLKWELVAALKVDYSADGNSISSYITEGSGAFAYTGWSYTDSQKSVTTGPGWVMNWRAAQFYNNDWIIDTTAYVKVYTGERHSWGTTISFVKGSGAFATNDGTTTIC